MRISGSGASYSLRRCSTWRAITSRNDSPRRTHSSDLARSMPIEVPRPPLSLMTTVVRMRVGGDLVVDLDVGERLHVERLDRGLRDHAGLAVLEQPVVVGEGLDRHLVHARVQHLLAGLVQTWTTHASIVGLPGVRPAIRSIRHSGATPSANAAKLALRDQLRDRSQPAQPARGRRGRAGDRRARAGDDGGTPGGHRGGVRLDRHRARHHRAAGDRWSRAGQAGRPAGACCPTSTSTGRSTAGRRRSPPRGWACSSRSARASASTRSPPPTSCSSPASPCLAHRRPDGPRRRLLRPRPRPASPSAPPSGCCSTTTRSASTSPSSPTTARSPAPSRRRGCTLRLRWSSAGEPVETSTDAPGSSGARPARPAITRSGTSVSVCSPASSTASRENGQGRVSPRGPEVGLVGVVLAERVAGDAGEVDPARVVEVGQRDDHPHRGREVDGVARRRRSTPAASTAAAPPPTSQPPRLTSHSTGPIPDVAERRARAARAGGGGPTPSRRRAIESSRVTSSRASSRAARRMSSRVSTVVGAPVVPPRRVGLGRAGRSPPPSSGRRRRARRPRPSRRGRSARAASRHTTLKYSAAALSAGWSKSQRAQLPLAGRPVAARQVDVEQPRHQRRRQRVAGVELDRGHVVDRRARRRRSMRRSSRSRIRCGPVAAGPSRRSGSRGSRARSRPGWP